MGIEESAQAPAPRHIGIIMDGNGRWATSRGLRRTRGHREGIEAAKRVVLAGIEEQVPCLSLYAFSTENWRRAEEEVSFIMALVARNLRDQYDFYRDNNVRVRHSGNLSGLPEEVQQEIATVTEETRGNRAITVNLAVNYGGRDEIARAVNRILAARTGDPSAAPVSIDDITDNLDLPELPDPDLIIRTGGERRLSNFLIWESAYSELYFSDCLWPDWSGDDLKAAITDFKQRKRNFGGMR